jgi:transcriptional antiterminator RfaH
MGDTNWYVVQCKPRQQDRALTNLERQGGECFLPRRRVERVQAGKRTMVEEALFPGYLFLSISLDDPLWSKLRSTFGVNRLVSFGGYPLPVEPGLIAAIRQFCIQGDPIARFKAGSTVQITQGALKGLQAIFETYDGETRAILLLKLLHQQQRVKIQLDCIEPA